MVSPSIQRALTGLLLSFCVTAGATRLNVSDYVMQNLILLFYPLNDANGYESLDKIKKNDQLAYDNINELKKKIARNVDKISHPSDYEVSKAIHSTIFSFCADKAYNYAYSKSKDKKVARKVSATIEKEMRGLYNKYSELPRGVYKNYIGSALKRRAHEFAGKLDTSKPHLYPTRECPICYNVFNHTDRIRVYVYQCGHNFCTECSYRWFFQENKQRCPYCNQNIDKKRLEQDLTDAALDNPSTNWA